MRRHWLHTAPAGHQPEPADNTAEHVIVQVSTWKRTWQHVHPEIAMEIASWWHGPNDPAVTSFSHAGVITPALLDEIAHDRANEQEPAEQDALDALAAYVRAVPGAALWPPATVTAEGHPS